MKPSDLFWDAPRPTGPQSTPGEKLFEFLVDHDRYLCELRDHGAYGVEAQFFVNEEFRYSRRFDSRIGGTLTPREMAIQWAEEERKALEKGASS
jgi:hypothetical protein